MAKWRETTTGPFSFEQVEGTHQYILRPPSSLLRTIVESPVVVAAEDEKKKKKKKKKKKAGETRSITWSL